MIGHSRGNNSAVPALSHTEAEALISGRLDAELTPQQERSLSAHLATCHACTLFAERMDAMRTGFRELPRLPASPTVSRQVRERIAQPASIWERIGMPGAVADQRLPDAVTWGGYPGGLAVTKGPSLFPRIAT